MEKFADFLKNLNDHFKGLPPGRKAAVLTLAASALAAVFVMSLWLRVPDYQLLFANLSPADAGTIIEELKIKNIDYKLTGQGRNIQIPSGQVYETRLALASKGLPGGSEVGFELFEDTPLGMTDFLQKLNFQRVLQGELSRTIKSLAVIDQARVHLAIPKNGLSLGENPKGKASVMVKVKAGKILSESQTQGIVHLISGSVESVSPQDVVIVDVKGNTLSGGGNGALNPSSNFAHKRRVEKDMEENIVKMLAKALGPGKVIVSVLASMDFNEEDSTEEIYDPDSQIVRNEHNVSELTVREPAEFSPIKEFGEDGDRLRRPTKMEKEKSILNYEINKIVRRTLKPAGQINSLSISVMIDGTLSGDPAVYAPRSLEEMSQYLDIIKSIVGFDASRGDQVKVENVQFDDTFSREIEREFSQAKIYGYAIELAKILLGIIFIVLLFAKVIRPLINWVVASAERAPGADPELPSGKTEAHAPEKNLAPSGFAAADMRKTLSSFIDSDPKLAAGIVRKWMRDRTPV